MPVQVQSASVAGTDNGAPGLVGVAPSRQSREQPQKGHYVLEPSFQYGYSPNNRIALVGWLVGHTVIPALLVGLVDVRQVKRNTHTAAVAGRIGITNSLVLEVRVPYVYRSDATVSRTIFTG